MMDRRSDSGRYASEDKDSEIRCAVSEPLPENKISSFPIFLYPPVRGVGGGGGGGAGAGAAKPRLGPGVPGMDVMETKGKVDS